MQQFAVKIPINSDNFPIINFPVFLVRRFSSSSPTHCHVCATTTCQRKKARSQLTRHQALSASIEPKHRIPDAVSKQIAKVYNSMVGHWDLQKCRERLNNPTITDQCSCCQVINRLKILISTHPFTCASYNPFESLNIDHIGPLPVDD